MPEGHTIHRLAARLTELYAGRAISAQSPAGRFAELAASLDGRTLVSAEAWGKHLLVRLADVEWVWHVHLGIDGSFTFVPPGRTIRRGRPALLHLTRQDGRGSTGVLAQAKICELASPPEVDALLDHLGPDVLRAEADPEQAYAAMHTSDRPLAELLLDQRVLAGVGNVYRNELLHRLRLDPFRSGSSLTRSEFDRLWSEAVRLLRVGFATGQILTTDRDLDRAAVGQLLSGAGPGSAPRTRGNPASSIRPTYAVHHRAGRPCPRCGVAATVRHQKFPPASPYARDLFWCPGCQVTIAD